jgi:NAD-dependent SIR2 family protein deacetylase
MMPRCNACNVELTDTEATRKDLHGDFLDLCNTCYYPIRKDVAISNNFDLTIVEHEQDNRE